VDFSTLVSSITANPAPALLAAALLALAWLYKEKSAADKASAEAAAKLNEQHAAAVRALYEAHLKAVQDMNAAHLATALQVAPLASKLAECVSLFERVVLPRGGTP
jgi:hypothetical protein